MIFHQSPQRMAWLNIQSQEISWRGDINYKEKQNIFNQFSSFFLSKMERTNSSPATKTSLSPPLFFPLLHTYLSLPVNNREMRLTKGFLVPWQFWQPLLLQLIKREYRAWYQCLKIPSPSLPFYMAFLNFSWQLPCSFWDWGAHGL